jgi:four helix bundle protein
MAAESDLSERLLAFAVRIVKLGNAMPSNLAGRHIGYQLLKAGTSPGANYEEARGAESRADFVHKLGMVLKEMKESRYWLRLVSRSELMKPARVASLIGESNELYAIFGQAVVTAKKRGRAALAN